MNPQPQGIFRRALHPRPSIQLVALVALRRRIIVQEEHAIGRWYLRAAWTR